MTKALRICLLVISVFFCTKLSAQDIPDEKFREAISDQCSTCIDVNGNLTADAESLPMLDADNDSIVDITGVAGFIALTEFYCNGNLISTLPPLPDSLKIFFCSDNLISVLPASLPSHLEEFRCENNNLTSIPVLPNTLTKLFCSANNLTTLPLLPPNLENLTCSDNLLTSLPALPATLTELYCDGNLITTLPALPDSLITFFCSDNPIGVLPDTLPSQLQQFKCENNNLASIPDLPGKLTQFFCSDNNLTMLPMLPAYLENLTCNDNSLTLLPALPSALLSLHCNLNNLVRLPALPPSLQKLYCSQNSISSLPELPSTLITLDISGNPISCFPRLPMNIQTIVYDFTNINCLPNFPYIFQTISPLPLCVGDSSACTLNPKVSGIAFIDYNGNGIKDGIDIPVKGMKIIADADNWMGYTDSVGTYEMSIGLGNTFTIAPVVPPGTYTVLPLSRTFNTSDTSGQRFVNSNFGLKPAGDNYDIRISLIPGIAVPASPAVYTVTYKNNSAFSIDATIQLVFDQNLSFVSADVEPSTQIGFTLGWDISLLPAFTSKSINVVFNVPGSETPGDILTSSVNSTLIAHTDLVPSNNSQTVTNEVMSSIVSNYLTVSDDTITPYDVAAGKYLEYILYFRNTGTAVADNLDVIDTLSNFLDAHSFEWIGASHHGSLEITNADFNISHPMVLHWTFNNIHLPPMNSDTVHSSGSINFLVRVGNNPSQNTLIKNKANILFGYASVPVTTSTTTLVQFPIGIANVPDDETIHITPNPFNDLIDIVSDKISFAPTIITLYDLAGKKIQQQSYTPASAKFSVDFGDLAPGAYLMTLKTGEGISSFKIFKQ